MATPFDPLALFELDFMPERYRQRLQRERFGPQISNAADEKAARMRAKELRKRRLGAFGLSDLTTGAGRSVSPEISKPDSLGF
ncbi:MAG: hypothetical protein DRQ55_11185 [Planctomycetota bacterium]|nr:MAG: hypothetical protein DRQ55_11185 [Planctomycetota bacterium]